MQKNRMKIDKFIEENENLGILAYEKKNMPYIYFICNRSGTVIYIGKTVTLSSRINFHKQDLRFANKYFYYFIVPIKQCLQKEKELIQLFNPKFNIAHNGPNIKPIKYNKEIRDFLKKNNIRQIDLSNKLGISKQAISLITKGALNSGPAWDKVMNLINNYEIKISQNIYKSVT